jgi:U4/U6 small nuclear ribonucleoprotein PRP3
MVHRIAWTEPARPRGAEEVELENPESDVEGADNGATGQGDGTVVGGSNKGKAKVDASGKEEGNGNESLEDNKCWLIWEGTLRERLFTGFRARSCPTEREAKELLGDMKGYWDMAKNWKGEEEELF